MSETTKRTLGADMIDLSVPWAERIDPTHLAARPVDQQALRAARLGAEGGVGDFTPTRSGDTGSAGEAQTSRIVEEDFATREGGALMGKVVVLIFMLAFVATDLWCFAVADGWAETIAVLAFAVVALWVSRRRASAVGVERETANSQVEIVAGCAARKIDPSRWFIIPLLLVSSIGFWCEIGGVPEIGLACYGLFAAFCGLGLASGFFSVVRGGDGV